MDGAIQVHGLGVRFDVPRRRPTGPAAERVGRAWVHWALRGVDLTVEPGEIMGLIGRNGAGKTTLLRAIAGIYPADEGSVRVGGAVAPVLALAAGVRVGLSAWENVELAGVLMGWTRREARVLAPQVVEMAGLEEFADAPLRVYSTGMRARLGFALATFVPHRILLLDEIFAVGDEEFRARGEERLRDLVRDGRTVVLAGHDLPRLAELADHVARFEHGRLVEVGRAAGVIERYTEHWRAAGRAPQ